jgi:hypothetical protein
MGRVQPSVYVLEDPCVGPCRTHTEAPFDLLGPGDLPTRQARGDAFNRFKLTAQPPPTIFLEVGVAETVQEELRFIA